MGFIYFICANATRDLMRKYEKKRVKYEKFMNKSSFFIVGQHAVLEALKNPKRKVLKVFLTEESKKNIHRKSPNKNLLREVKVYFKTKKELDKYGTKENLLHQGYVAEIEHLEKPILKEFIKKKNNIT